MPGIARAITFDRCFSRWGVTPLPAHKKAEGVIKKHRKALNAIAAQLVEVETIERDEFEKILIANGITPKKKEDIEHQPLA